MGSRFLVASLLKSTPRSQRTRSAQASTEQNKCFGYRDMDVFAFLQFCTFCWYIIFRNVDLDTLNKRAANYLRVLTFAILLSCAEIVEINTRENMSP